MKKLFFALGLLLVTTLVADEIDEQIQKLEKENKLLELQKKKAQLEKENKLLELQKKNRELQSKLGTKGGGNTSSLSLASQADSKNGIFLGAEVANILAPADIIPVVIGAFGGYQHYFGKSQTHGIKATLHLHSNFTDVLYDGSVDVKYLWDFLQRGKHTLGFNAGLGFMLYSYSQTVYNPTTCTIGTAFSNSSYACGSYEKENQTAFNVAIVLGLHYYYKHHQFELLSGYPDLFTLNYAYRF